MARSIRPIDISSYPDGFVAKFWSRVDIRGEDDCWEWKRARTQSGYGVIPYGDGTKCAYANRVSLAIKLGGRLGGEFFALHSCDNPPCCNPAHLTAGTNSDNMRDRSSHGRHPVGSKQAHSKLTESDIRDIRRYRADGESYSQIARRFPVTASAIGKIALGITWSHVVS